MIKCGFLGPIGTYSYQAALEIIRKRGQNSSIIFEALITIPSLFQCNACDYIVVPVENSTSGCVAQTLQALYAAALGSKAHSQSVNHASATALPADAGTDSSHQSVFKVIDQTAIPINHCFMKHPATDVNNINKVYSHPEAIAQCTLWLQKHYPNAQLVPVSSTAHGAKLASTDHTSASISNRVCAELYNLDIVAEDLAPSANTTRFLLLQRSPLQPIPTNHLQQKYCTLILHEPRHDYLSVDFKILSSLSLERVFSKPVPVHMNPTAPLWSHFYLYIVKGRETDENVKEAVNLLSKHSHITAILGSFPTE